MPRRSSRQNSDEDEEERSRKNPRRGIKNVSYAEENAGGDDPMDVDSDENPTTSDDEELEAEESSGKRRSRARAKKGDSAKENVDDTKERRTSSRATKFKGGMKEPPEHVRDLLKETNEKKPTNKTTARRKGSSDSMDEDEVGTPKKPKRGSQKQRQKAKLESPPHKSPARRHKQARLSLSHHTTQPDESDESSVESEMEEVDEEDEEPFKIQRILASRTEPRNKWADICKNMNTSEIDYGSRWVQDPVDESDDSFEERFLVKWSDMSYMHVSWETESDLMEQVEGAKTYLSTFFRKSHHGLLFDSDERCDGDYFDPAWTQIDRILEVHFPEECPCKSVPDEDAITNEDLGIVLDKDDPEFENGLGREFLIKWGNCAYSEGTYEFERDLILNEVDYKDQLKSFNRRRKRLPKDKAKKLQKEGEAEFRRLYKSLFGDKSNSKQEEGVEEFQQKLQDHVYKNGGQLRDYQAVGVSWLMSNYVNKRSCILADEMGLGKTLQTASFVNHIATQLNRRGPFLIVAPLSTLAHWQREFEGWTDLNTIVYHGSAKDRDLIREKEIAHESLRPQGGVGFNQLYLRKCIPKKNNPVVGNPWMAEVVITTPELLCADDFMELTAVKWECLVVDEAQKLKNHSSKLATNLRDPKFEFRHKLLLTGTPIQNTMEELFALLSFIDPDLFGDCDEFMEKYGDIKSKEKIDQLHEEIRPYILRRLKEDAEKSVPPKEETVIEVELTVAQKQYYRALYEKNVKFLNKNKKKALDGPSLNNLAMQLRKCCNHLFLLNGIEDTFRDQQRAEGLSLSEGDLLVKASGKLVLLDKLLPRLKENGHRILIFSQFKIMLDVLEDYLHARTVNFERIDGSITGKKRQQAIDRFQAPSVEGRDQPFVMLLSTRAGGVGINLTAADTCIIFDSDWNPQNDLQAQARCHRIGQTKNVKVFRLLTRNTYELQMFHMSSMKMGLDQAVLSGFESGASGDGALSKEEVEKLLRHGAYGIFSEDKDGAEESNAFVQQDIDTILERRARTVVHDNTGSNSSAAGGTFSKARFAAPKGAEGKKAANDDVDIDDPDFWKKMVGEGQADDDEDDLAGKPRKRKVTNYSEGAYDKNMELNLLQSDAEGDDDEEYDSADDESFGSGDEEGEKRERSRWGGSRPGDWKQEEAKKLLTVLHSHGYNNIPWTQFTQELAPKNNHSADEVQRMCGSVLLMALCELAEDDALQQKRRALRKEEKKRDAGDDGPNPAQGGVLAESQNPAATEERQAEIQKCFDKLWVSNASWAASAMKDLLQFAQKSQPRSEEMLARVMHSAAKGSAPMKQDEFAQTFSQTVWPSLKTRGWKAVVVTEGSNAGKTQYSYEDKKYYSPESALAAAGEIHSELSNVVEKMLNVAESSRQKSKESEAKLREKHLAMKTGTIVVSDLLEFLRKYAPLQLMFDRKHGKKIALSARKIVNACTYMDIATTLVKRAEESRGEMPLVDKLASMLVVDKRQALPHPLWSIRHDAVLLTAIAKNGWIDNDSACRRITKDSEIKWGFPFDSDYHGGGETDEGKKSSQKDDLINSLRETANRAAEFFNEHHDIVHESKKWFNQNPVIRAYSLEHEDNDNDSDGDAETERPKWVVDEAALLASTGLDSSESAQNVELPPKKDLAKRIKAVLTKNSDSRGDSTNLMQVDSSVGELQENFCVIDQSDRCNILLAEIIRAIVKIPYPRSQNELKLLCSIACEEAGNRAGSIAPKSDATDQANKRAKAAEEMTEVIKNVNMVKRCIRQTKLAKNVLKAMLGIDVQATSGGGPVFPSKGDMASVAKAGGQRQSNNGAKSKKEDSATGDKALARAMSKCMERNNGGVARVLPEGHSSDLELTAIETLIISVICSQGLPVWTDDTSSIFGGQTSQASADEAGEASGDERSSLSMSWVAFGNILLKAAKEWQETAARKVEACQQEYDKHQDREDEYQSKVRARKYLANAIKHEEVKEKAASLAAGYAEDPEILAQKTIMLVERVRMKMGLSTGGHTKPAKKTNHWLGPKVLDFLSSQLSLWSKTLEITDGNGKTLSYTAADFYHDLPDSERENFDITAYLNKPDCRLLLIQITLVSRLRSLFLKHPREELMSRIATASKNTKVGDTWEAQPPWWSLGETPFHHDALLLEGLVEFGFSGVLDNARGFGPPDKTDGQLSLKDLELSKAMIQQRANQLVRELHALDRSDDILRVIDQRRSDANSSSGGNNTTNNRIKQQNLLSFFVKTGTGKKGSSVVELSDTEEDSTTILANGTKNNAVNVVEVEASPQPRENQDEAPLSGEKRASRDPPESTPSPEKKLRSS